jgi:hypothetical protein
MEMLMRICIMLSEDEKGHDLVVAVAPRVAHFLTQTPLRNPRLGEAPATASPTYAKPTHSWYRLIEEVLIFPAWYGEQSEHNVRPGEVRIVVFLQLRQIIFIFSRCSAGRFCRYSSAAFETVLPTHTLLSLPPGGKTTSR